MSEGHSLKKRSSLNEAFKSYEPTRTGIAPKTQKRLKNNCKNIHFFYKKNFNQKMNLSLISSIMLRNLRLRYKVVFLLIKRVYQAKYILYTK